MTMTMYGAELALGGGAPARRLVLRVFGSYDLGARVRYAALRRSLRALPTPEAILDVGSGRGLLCFALARRWPRARVLGVDIDRERIGEARALAHDAKLDGRVGFGHVDDRDPKMRFSLVTCIDVMEHVDDDVGFVRNLFAATAPGGACLIHVPAAHKRRFLAAFPEQADHVRPGYDAGALAAMLRFVGFDDVQVRATFGVPGALAWEGFALARRGKAVARGLLPLWYLLALIDTIGTPRRGNGVFAIARRKKGQL
jgi:SAM-dependent methyltransferase